MTFSARYLVPHHAGQTPPAHPNGTKLALGIAIGAVAILLIDDVILLMLIGGFNHRRH